MKELKEYMENAFESIKHIDIDGVEYWKARELEKTLGYKNWNNFNKVIKKAKLTCKNSNISVLDNFVYFEDMINYHLTRFACYLIIQNADPRKEAVALAQNYIVRQTIRCERINKTENK